MDEKVPMEMLIDMLLPVELRTELCITGMTITGDVATFRIDPGGAFERRAYVRNIRDARFLVGVAERYLPDSPREYVCGCDGIPAGDVPDQLRSASGWAYTWDEDRDHWRDARPRLCPDWSQTVWDAETAVSVAATRALSERVTHYISGRPGEFICANNPPPDMGFFSVTARRTWAVHDGRETYPLETAPAAADVSDPLGERKALLPPRLASADRVDSVTSGVVLPFSPRGSSSARIPGGRRKRL